MKICCCQTTPVPECPFHGKDVINEWKPIKSSPRDGSVFMAFVPHSQIGFQFCATWNTDNRLVCMMSGDDFTYKATLWRAAHPLPEESS